MQICPNCGEENPPRFRLCGFCGTPFAQELPPQELRKTVTIVFSDLKGSTAMGEKLDPESVREVMSRYFDVMREALERHGGRVEKYIGDAIMAVFGLPRVHEDDALRAVRAAFEMKEALATLNVELEQRWGIALSNRTGVNTGEVVAGDPTLGQRLVTGDTVNTAARLEQAAPANEILLGEPTHRLVRAEVEVEPVEPLEAKGKSEPLPAYRLVAVARAAGPVAPSASALVGREAELEQLSAALEGAIAAGAPRLVCLLGEAGVGKSRLLEELASREEARARFLRGRCLSYGRGITFWPLLEIASQAAAIGEDDPPELAREKLRAAAGGREDVAERVAAAIGLSEAQFSVEELFFGARKLLEALAADAPLAVVLEDVHWAETTLLQLVEHLERTAAAPILFLCSARDDLLEREPSWAEKETLSLQPLSAEDSGRIVENLLGAAVPEAVRDRIVTAAEGNPLFAEQLLSMLVDDGLLRREGDGWVVSADLSQLDVPPTIGALLEARLDMLSREERATVEPASVIGVYFALAALATLVPEAIRPALDEHLGTVEQKQLVRREADDADGMRFSHILVREAAYNGLLKRTRAELHEAFADWAERVNRERDREIEFEEITGYHLEQAYGYLAELGPLDEHGLELGRRAAEKLASAGRRAFGRGDMPAAANLLRRAVSVLPDESRERLELLPDLGEALMEVGEFAWAELYLEQALSGAAGLGDLRLRADALLARLHVRHHTDEDFEAWAEEVERETAALIPQLEERGAHAELAQAWRIIAIVHATPCHWEETADAQRRATEHARLAGLTRQEARMAAAYTIALAEGPTPLPEAVERCRDVLARGLVDRQAEATAMSSLASLLAMRGEFEEARSLCRQALELNRELGAELRGALAALTLARVEQLAGDPEAAEQALRPHDARLEAMGERYFRPLVLAEIARALGLQDRWDEADELAALAQEQAAASDVEPQALWRLVRAQALARAGSAEEARRLAREAVELLADTDALLIRTEALVTYARVLRRTGLAGEAAEALERAHELCRIKQMPGPALTVERLLAELRPQAAAERVPSTG